MAICDTGFLEKPQGGGGFSCFLGQASKINPYPRPYPRPLGVFASFWPQVMFARLITHKNDENPFLGLGYFLGLYQGKKNKTPIPLGVSRRVLELLFFWVDYLKRFTDYLK